MKKVILFFLFVLFSLPQSSYAEQTLLSSKVEQAPVLDGLDEDLQWRQATEIISHDPIASIDISIKAVHTQTTLFLLVSYPDSDESRLHKPWVWDSRKQMYTMGPQREDTLVLKWPLSQETSDFSLSADQPYEADIWFWKANRTDPAGFADDKLQILNTSKQPRSKELLSKSKKTMYLQRLGDQGRPSYKSQIPIDYTQDILPQFQSQQPSGSRADITAKGSWKNNRWIIEFARPLQTGEKDDIQLELDKEYTFGISRYEIAGRPEDARLSQPLYGSGDTSERLILKFAH